VDLIFIGTSTALDPDNDVFFSQVSASSTVAITASDSGTTSKKKFDLSAP
jgi:hypothetical protein